MTRKAGATKRKGKEKKLALEEAMEASRDKDGVNKSQEEAPQRPNRRTRRG